MILIIYFDTGFASNLQKQCNKHNLKYKLIHFEKVTRESITSDIHTIVICGSYRRILRDGHIPILDWLYNNTTLPIIGLCYGFQYMAFIDGGKIKECAHFKGNRHDGHHYNHYDRVLELPPSWTVIDRIDEFISIAAKTNRIGFQFHPENTNKGFQYYLLPLLAKAS